ncbi:MAG: class I SAM-dependent methyltransferase [Pseudomonadota bacterium]
MGLWERFAVPPLVSAACATKPFQRQRQKIVPAAEGRILEIGCGSGANFPFYTAGKVDHLWAVEPAPGMLSRAAGALDTLPIAGRTSLIAAGAENLPLENASVDTAVVTFVLCTLPDWPAACAELRRVLRPGGRVLFSEHGRAPDPGVAKWQRRVEPLWRRLAGGCHLTRDPAELLRAGGFALEHVERMYLPSTPRIAGFATWGMARLAAAP